MTDVQPDAQDAMGLQFSIYPLRQSHLRPAIAAAVRAASETGVPQGNSPAPTPPRG